MTSEIFCVCDSASVADGKLDIRGTFSRLACPVFPIVLPPPTVVATLRFDTVEEGIHKLEVSVFNLEDKIIGPPAKAQFPVTAEGDDVQAWQTAIIQIPNVRFASPGDFRFALNIDGHSVASCLLCVVAVK